MWPWVIVALEKEWKHWDKAGRVVTLPPICPTLPQLSGIQGSPSPSNKHFEGIYSVYLWDTAQGVEDKIMSKIQFLTLGNMPPNEYCHVIKKPPQWPWASLCENLIRPQVKCTMLGADIFILYSYQSSCSGLNFFKAFISSYSYVTGQGAKDPPFIRYQLILNLLVRK